MMKKLVFILVILFVLYFGVQIGFKYFGNGHNIQYEIINGDHKFQVSENLTIRHKDEHDNYYFEIKKDDFQLSFQTYYDLHKYENVIIDIKYYKDTQYECVLPIFRGDLVLFDMMCQDQSGVVFYYHDLKGKNISLDKYVTTLSEVGYDVNMWVDSLNGKTSSKEVVTVYHDNLVEDHYVALTNYKGLYTISNDDGNKIFNVSLFSKDIYERTVSTQVGRYYLTANYDSNYDFTSFILVDIMYNDNLTLKYHSKISFDSYFMGVVEDSAYLYDKKNKKQYEIDVKHRKVVEIGNETVGIKMYKNGVWSDISVSELSNKNLYFDTANIVDIDTTGYARVDKVGNKILGYYYFYRSTGNGYDVYRADVMNPKLHTYLFHTSNISSVQYVDDYVYYVDGNKIKYYQDQLGVRTLLKNSELAFNNGIAYYLHKK